MKTKKNPKPKKIQNQAANKLKKNPTKTIKSIVHSIYANKKKEGLVSLLCLKFQQSLYTFN